ncbi:hypothetical protein QZH41_001157 [Actinostola sp. cb2023]|nr:hypothetical protein QZH41_001157 [Actinostola sp. cb2023]
MKVETQTNIEANRPNKMSRFTNKYTSNHVQIHIAHGQTMHLHGGFSGNIDALHSIHWNCHEDRVWYFTCQSAPTWGATCSDFTWANAYDKRVDFTCPNGGYIAGIKSTYNAHYKDRRYAFKCCRTPGMPLNDCKGWGGYVNDFDQEIHYSVASGYYLTGLYSWHNDRYE